MLDKDIQISELYDLKHMNDDIEQGFDYESNFLTTTFSNVMFKNTTTYNFLKQIKKLFIYNIESNLIARNWFNYTVSKYESRHNN